MTVNNIQVSLLAFAGGILLCVPTAALLVFNGANVGVAGGLFAAAGQLAKFFGLILPHGLLELTAVIVAGAAGLRLGWSIIAPGDRPAVRGRGGRRPASAVVIALGLALAFVVAGLIEGFVTGRGVPTPLRVAIGVGGVGRVRLLGRHSGPGGDRPGRHRPARRARPRLGRAGGRPRACPRPPAPEAQKPGSEPAGGLDPQVGVGQLGGERAGSGVDDRGAQAAEAGDRAAALVERRRPPPPCGTRSAASTASAVGPAGDVGVAARRPTTTTWLRTISGSAGSSDSSTACSTEIGEHHEHRPAPEPGQRRR